MTTGRPLGWKASDEAFALWLAALQANRRRVARLAYERPTIPSWVAAHRGYATWTKQYRQLISGASPSEERTA